MQHHILTDPMDAYPPSLLVIRTKQLCHDHCNKSSAAYMATMFGQLCLCGWDEDVEEYTQGGEGTCSTSCVGDMGETCGGQWSYDLYQLQDASSGSTTPLQLAPSPSPISRPSSTITPPTPSPMDSPAPTPVEVSTPSGGESSYMGILLDLHNAAR